MPTDLSPDIANWFFAAWMLLLGGIIGSFLNVVVYRVPAGLSIVAPGSHCPRCKHPIRWYDNMPVLGWLLLRGRCRDCGLPIAMRYPLVEAASAAIFLALALAAGVFGGTNLPLRGEAVAADEVIWTMRSVSLLTSIAVYHAFLLSTLLCTALIEYDARRAASPVHNRIVAKLFLPAMIVGFAAPAFLGEGMRPTSCGLCAAASMVDGLCGLLAGGLMGVAVSLMFASKEGARGAIARCSMEVWALAAVGVFLGWQAVSGIALVAVGGMAITALLSRWLTPLRSFPPVGWIGLTCLAWILLWSQIAWLLPGLAPMC